MPPSRVPTERETERRLLSSESLATAHVDDNETHSALVLAAEADETIRMEREIAEVEAAVLEAEAQLRSWSEIESRFDRTHAHRARMRAHTTHADEDKAR